MALKCASLEKSMLRRFDLRYRIVGFCISGVVSSLYIKADRDLYAGVTGLLGLTKDAVCSIDIQLVNLHD